MAAGRKIRILHLGDPFASVSQPELKRVLVGRVDFLSFLNHEFLRGVPLRRWFWRGAWAFRIETLLATYQREVVRLAEAFRPDLVLCVKGHFVTPNLIEALRRLTSVPIVNLNVDDWFSTNRHNFSKAMHRAIPYYDVLFTTKSHNVPELYKAGAKRVVFIFSWYGPSFAEGILDSAGTSGRGAEVVFIGSYELDRARSLEYLIRRLPGLDLGIWGPYWQRFVVYRHRSLRRFYKGRGLWGREAVRVLQASKIALGFLRKANRDTHTSRSMEIPAAGAFFLAEKTEEHDFLLGDGIGYVGFVSDEHLADRVSYYLDPAHDTERKAIAEEGRRRILSGGHSFEERICQILGECGISVPL
jgi:spore maturation protein CgeB